MKVKLLKRLRKDADFVIDVIRNLSTSEFIIREMWFEWEIKYYKTLYKTKDRKEAEKLLHQAKRMYILKQAGIKKINF